MSERFAFGRGLVKAESAPPWSYFDEITAAPFTGEVEPQLVQHPYGMDRRPPPQINNYGLETPRPRAAPARPATPTPKAEPPASAPTPAPPASTAPEPPWSYADEALGAPPPPSRVTPAASGASPPDPNAEPDASTWVGRRVQDVMGRQDKRYANLPSVTETGYVPIADESAFRLTGSSDKAYGDFLAKQLQQDGRFLRRFSDANGYEILEFKGNDGKPVQAYVNKPTWEFNDIDRGVSGVVPFIAGPAVLGHAARAVRGMGVALPQVANLPILARMGLSATAGAGISAAQDAAAVDMGSEQGTDIAKLIGAGVGGALGEAIAPAIGAAIRHFVTVPGLYNRATGKLTEKGAETARRAGLDPDEISTEIAKTFAESYARSGRAKAAGIEAELGDLGIPTTLGQRTKDVRQLATEQSMRDGVWGDKAAHMMKDFDRRQWEAMVRATMGEVAPGRPGLGPRLAPNRSTGEYSPAEVGRGIQEGARSAQSAMREAERTAWEKVGRLNATDESLRELPAYINASLGTMRINANSHPIASQLARDLEAFMAGEAPEQVAKFLTGNPARDVNSFRQMMSEAMRDMPRGPDRTAAGRIYDGLNQWIRDAADHGLFTASTPDAAVAAANMAAARGISREFHKIVGASGSTTGARIIKQILETADSPDQVVRALFAGPDAKSVKPGTIAALNSLKQMASRLPEPEAAALMGDIKLAFWLRQVRNPQGELYNPQKLLGNLRQSRESHRTVWQTLYTPAERAYANRLIKALENGPTFHDWTIKPNSSRTATTAATLIIDFMGMMMGKQNARSLFEIGSKVIGAGRYQAGTATEQTAPAIVPRLPGPALSAIGAESQQRQ